MKFSIVILLFSIYNFATTQNEVIGQYTWWDAVKSGVINTNNLQSQERITSTCNLILSQEIQDELVGYKEITQSIVEMATVGEWAGRTYQDLKKFVDKFGSRISGSDSLEESIMYMLDEMENIELTNVHIENVTVPKWIRGEESAHIIEPRIKSLDIMALGYSIPTPPEGITAPVIVVNSFENLIANKRNIKGKIVVYASPNRNLEGAQHTMIGAAYAAKFGGVAALVKSLTPFSLNTPHAGLNFYRQGIRKIPVAALTPEDGDLISRFYEDGEEIVIHLRIDILENTFSLSQNLIGDLQGREIPDEYVVVSGHIDSWDVGQGAVDDGVGVILAFETVNMLKTMNLIPRRTLRSIFWTAEEFGLYGVHQYILDHGDDTGNYSAALEADYGCFKAVGFLFTGNSEVGCILQEILDQTLLNITKIIQTNVFPSDISVFAYAEVPTILLIGDDGRYYWYQHTEADVITVLNSKELDICLAIWASANYIIADLKEKLPRTKL